MKLIAQGISEFSNLETFIAVKDGDRLLETVATIAVLDLSEEHKQLIQTVIQAHLESLSLNDTFELLSH